MFSLLIIAFATFTQVNDPTNTVDAFVQVPSVTAYANLVNASRTEVFTDQDGNDYVMTDARVVVFEEQ